MHGPFMFAYMAYLLRDALSDKPYFPPSGLNSGSALTQRLLIGNIDMAMQLTTNHFTDIFSIKEETSEGSNYLLRFSLESSVTINNLEFKHPVIKMSREFELLLGNSSCRELHNMFFSAYAMAGVVIESYVFEDISLPVMINNLEFYFSVRDTVRRQIDPSFLQWIQDYLSSLKQVVVI